MSMDFTMVFTGPECRIGNVLESIERGLSGTGFIRSSAVVRVDFDEYRGVFDESDEEGIDGMGTISEVLNPLNAWSGGAVEFSRPETGTIYLLVGRGRENCINAWVDVHERTFRRLFAQNLEGEYYAALNVVAKALTAAGAFGNHDGSFEPLLTNDLLTKIRRGIRSDTQDPTQLFVVPNDRIPALQARARWGCRTKIWQFLRGYTVIETEAFKQFWNH
ncbi:MAG: hypothetical protein HKM93_09015 [Desulfobacteraceae bacterium]|nr:hypothetical protein [Desulfobacteraceae bacterium]